MGAAFVAFYAVWWGQTVWADGSRARGYASASVVRSPLARAVKQLPSDALVVTNRPWALYWGSGHAPVLPEPGPLAPAASLVPATRTGLLGAACDDPVYVAWYGASAGPTAAPALGLSLRAVRTVADGSIYALAAHPRCDPERGEA
jgi:hypothetical protein